MIIKNVDVNYCAQVWPLVKDYLNDALTKGPQSPSWSDNYSIDHVQGFITSGTWVLIVALDIGNKIQGALTVSFTNYPKNRVAFITLIGGKLISNEDTFKQLTELLKEFGATKIQGMARPAVARLWKQYGFEQRTTLVEVKL